MTIFQQVKGLRKGIKRRPAAPKPNKYGTYGIAEAMALIGSRIASNVSE